MNKRLLILGAAAAGLIAILAGVSVFPQFRGEEFAASVLRRASPPRPQAAPSRPARGGNLSPQAQNGIICFEKSENGGMVEVKVRARDISQKIFGIAFDLEFNPAALLFVDYKNGGFFEKTARPIYIVKAAPGGGRIAVGITLKRGDAMLVGSGILISLYFRRTAGGEEGLRFFNTAAAALENDVRKNLPEIVFQPC